MFDTTDPTSIGLQTNAVGGNITTAGDHPIPHPPDLSAPSSPGFNTISVSVSAPKEEVMTLEKFLPALQEATHEEASHC